MKKRSTLTKSLTRSWSSLKACWLQSRMSSSVWSWFWRLSVFKIRSVFRSLTLMLTLCLLACPSKTLRRLPNFSKRSTQRTKLKGGKLHSKSRWFNSSWTMRWVTTSGLSLWSRWRSMKRSWSKLCKLSQVFKTHSCLKLLSPARVKGASWWTTWKKKKNKICSLSSKSLLWPK